MARSTVHQIEPYHCQNVGCNWIGRSMHAEEHAYKCNYRILSCTCCNEKIAKGAYHDHLLLYCRNKMDVSYCDEWLDNPLSSPCPNSHLQCRWRGTPAMFQKRHQYQCNKQQKQCAACEKFVQKGKLCSHVLNVCSSRLRIAEGTFGNGVYLFNNEPSQSANKKQ